MGWDKKKTKDSRHKTKDIILKNKIMKLSAIVLSAMISFSAVAQTPKPKEGDKPKTKTTTTKDPKAKKDSVKVSKGKEKVIGPDYCPPCGMG